MRRWLAALALAAAPSIGAASCRGSGALSIGGLYGPYPATREAASGTAWGPEASPVDVVPFSVDGWTGLARGFGSLVYDNQTGPRGASKLFLQDEVFLAARRPFGAGAWGARAAASLEPVMGKRGYPLLLQTDGSVDGTPLVDRQPPRDLLQELAATFNMPVSGRSSAFVYAGLVGEPALGPAPAARRFSGQENPEAPITRQWLEPAATSHGVMTLGYVWDGVKLEGSAFNGRQPDENRWDVDPIRWDSHAARLTVNPDPALSAQVSFARFHRPDILRPDRDIRRMTVSVGFGSGPRQVTAAWGRNKDVPGGALNGFLLEAAARVSGVHTLFARAESVEKRGLLSPSDPQSEDVAAVGKLAAGYVRDFFYGSGFNCGAGGSAGVDLVPASLRRSYGRWPLSFMLFVRARLGLPREGL